MKHAGRDARPFDYFCTKEEVVKARKEGKAAFLAGHPLTTPRNITINGESHNAKAWAKIIGISRQRVYQLAKIHNLTLKEVKESRLHDL